MPDDADGVESSPLWIGNEPRPEPLVPVKLIKRGVWGGAVRAIEPHGDTVYIGAGRRLVILHVEDQPRGGVEITELGSVDLGQRVHDLKVRNGYVYAATLSLPGFVIVDVSDPTEPQIVWQNSDGLVAASQEIELHGDYALVRTTGGAIRYVRINDTTTHAPLFPPVILGTSPVVQSANSFLIDENKLYTVTGLGELRIYNIILSPTGFPNLSLCASTDLPGASSRGASVAVNGDYVYTLSRDADGSFAVFDASNCASPTLLGSVLGQITAASLDPITLRASSEMAVSGNFVLVADPDTDGPGVGAHGLAIVDVSDPNNPYIAASWHTHSSAITRAVVDGSHAYVVDEGEGLLVLDLAQPTRPVIKDTFHSPAKIRKFAKAGPYLYATDKHNGISILRVTDPDRPRLRGVYQTALGAEKIRDIQVRNGLAYITTGWGGIETVDVSDPANPTQAGAFPFAFGVQSMALDVDSSGHFVHVGVRGGCCAAFVVNFSVDTSVVPNIIADVGSIELGAGGIFVYTIDAEPNSLLHVAQDVAVMVINSGVDSDPPVNPSILASEPGPTARDLLVRGNLRYVAMDDGSLASGGLIIQDVSDPAGPVQMGSVPINALSVDYDEASGHVLFVGRISGAGGLGDRLVAVDATDPASPSVVDSVSIPQVQEVFVSDGFAYVTGDEIGSLVIYEIRPEPVPCPLLQWLFSLPPQYWILRDLVESSCE